MIVDVTVPAPAPAPPPPRPQPPPADHRGDDAKKDQAGKKDEKGGDHPKPVRRRSLIIGAIIIVVLLALFLLIGILPRRNRDKKLQQQAQQTAHNDSIPAVSVVKVAAGDSVAEFNLPGNVQAEREAAVYARATGYVRRFLVDIGQRVHAGQVLAVLDIPDVEEQLREARANESQAEATLRLARVELARWRILYRDSVITREELDQRQANYDAAVASVAAAQANVRRNAELVGYGSVIAPFSGIVTARNVDEGVLVSGGGSSTSTNPASLGGNTILTSNSAQSSAAGGTGSTVGGSSGSGVGSSSGSGSASGSSAGASGVGGSGSLFRVAQADTVRLYVGVPQSYAGDVRTGLRANVHVPDMPQRAFTGKVVRTAGALDASTRTLLTEVDLPNLDRRLLPGMYATVSFRLTRANLPVMIPAGSLLVRQQGAQAAVVGSDSVLQIRQITVGRDYGSQMEVLTGLKPGDLVVVNPTDELRNGQRVRPRAQSDEDAAGGNSPGGRPANPPPVKSGSGGQGGGGQQQGKGGQGGGAQSGGQGTGGGGGGGTSGSGSGGGGGGQGSQQGGGGAGGGAQGGQGGGGQGGGGQQPPPVVRIGPPGRPSSSGRP